MDAIAGLNHDERWLQTAYRFSLKEAIFKALDPVLRRDDLRFTDIAITTPVLVAREMEFGAVDVELNERLGAKPLCIYATLGLLDGRILASARTK